MTTDRVLLHHPAGEGEYFHPIAPFWTTATHFRIPSIEEALLGEFSSRHPKRHIAEAIFIESLDESAARLQRIGYIDGTASQLRIRLAKELFAEGGGGPKLDRFIQAHGSDGTYVPLGPSRYDEDRNLIQVTTKRYQSRLYPLQIIRRRYPDLKWTLEECVIGGRFAASNDAPPSPLHDAMSQAASRPATLLIMDQCKRLHATEESMEVRDALWFYYLCFFDSMDREMTPLTYPYDNRCFTAYDLPDAMHVLTSIPMCGEQVEPTFVLGKFIQKSLPFAGARRALTEQTAQTIMTNEAFWRVFSSLLYCMLVDTYPEHVSRDRTRCFDVARITAIRRYVSDREAVRASLVCNGTSKETDRNCYVIFTAFRLWMVMMVGNQPHYVDAIRHCLDWTQFEAQVADMARTIRGTLDLSKEDMYVKARAELTRTKGGSAKPKVYRYRKSDATGTILEQLIARQQTNVELDGATKTALLNALIHVPASEWLEPLSLSMMRVHGGLSEADIGAFFQMLDLYRINAKPKEYVHVMARLGDEAVRVSTWYFNVLRILGSIRFEPWQPVSTPTSVYFTICCGKIKTLLGSRQYGIEGVAYDMTRDMYVCTKSFKKVAAYNDDEAILADMIRQEQQPRKRRKYRYFPCNDNPVLHIDLRGLSLVHDGLRYAHCGTCGALHRVVWTGFYGPDYACPECRSAQREYRYTCHTCGKTVTGDNVRTVADPSAVPYPVFRLYYFCRKH